MEKGPFADDFPIKTSISNGFSKAMLVITRWYPFFLRPRKSVQKNNGRTILPSQTSWQWKRNDKDVEIHWLIMIRHGYCTYVYNTCIIHIVKMIIIVLILKMIIYIYTLYIYIIYIYIIYIHIIYIHIIYLNNMYIYIYTLYIYIIYIYT